MHSLMLVPPAGDDLQAFHSTRSTIFVGLTRIISILISSTALLGMVLPHFQNPFADRGIVAKATW